MFKICAHQFRQAFFSPRLYLALILGCTIQIISVFPLLDFSKAMGEPLGIFEAFIYFSSSEQPAHVPQYQRFGSGNCIPGTATIVPGLCRCCCDAVSFDSTCDPQLRFPYYSGDKAMKGRLFTRVFDHHTFACYFAAIALMLFLVGGHRSPLLFFMGFSAQDGAGGLDIMRTMEWNLCVLPPVSASILFLMPELGALSTYTIVRSKNIRRWWLMRLAAVVVINYVFFLFALVLLSLISGAELLLAEWSTAAVLFPLHTTLLSSLCAGGMILFTSRATIIFYLLVECGLLAVGMAYPPVSLFLPPYWGMAQAMGDRFSSAVAVSVFLLIVLNLGIIYWLSRHNPAANPQSK